MSTYQASAALVVVVDGRPVHLDERYRRMILWILDLRVRMDGVKSGKLHLAFKEDAVGVSIEEVYSHFVSKKAG